MKKDNVDEVFNDVEKELDETIKDVKKTPKKEKLNLKDAMNFAKAVAVKTFAPRPKAPLKSHPNT